MDGDADGNGLLQYTITGTAGPATPTTGRGGFVIDGSSGTVRTTGSFDREEFRGPYSIMVSQEHVMTSSSFCSDDDVIKCCCGEYMYIMH